MELELSILRAEHREIESIASALTAMLERPTPPEQFAFLHLRRNFNRALVRHLWREDWTVYPHLEERGSQRVREIAEGFQCGGSALAELLSAHNRRWTEATIAADWNIYRRTTLALLDKLGGRIAIEEEELYPLLENDRGPGAPERDRGGSANLQEGRRAA